MTRLSAAQDRSFHAFWLRFHDAAIEADYIQHSNARVVVQARVVALIAVLVVSSLTVVEYFGFSDQAKSGSAYETWLAGVPVRALDIAILLIGVGLSRFAWAVRNGQMLVALIATILFLLVLVLAADVGPAIMMLTMFVNYGLAIVLLAFGLLFRVALVLGVIFPLGYAPFVFGALDAPWPPLFLVFATSGTMLWIAYALERARRTAWADAMALAEEQALTERLLLNVLPPSIAHRMQDGETLIADSHDEATVVFADIVDFTPMSASMSPRALVDLLDEVFAAFDEIADRCDLEKIKTIGDAYMMAAGLPTERSADPANALHAALAMRGRLAEIAAERNIALSLRAGVHIGPVVAGVIGKSKFVYDLWGDSVNIASRMESTAPPGAIQVSDDVRARLEGAFHFTPRGEIDVEGKGPMRTWLLDGPRT